MNNTQVQKELKPWQDLMLNKVEPVLLNSADLNDNVAGILFFYRCLNSDDGYFFKFGDKKFENDNSFYRSILNQIYDDPNVRIDENKIVEIIREGFKTWLKKADEKNQELVTLLKQYLTDCKADNKKVKNIVPKDKLNPIGIEFLDRYIDDHLTTLMTHAMDVLSPENQRLINSKFKRKLTQEANKLYTSKNKNITLTDAQTLIKKIVGQANNSDRSNINRSNNPKQGKNNMTTQTTDFSLNAQKISEITGKYTLTINDDDNPLNKDEEIAVKVFLDGNADTETTGELNILKDRINSLKSLLKKN